jgi:hypothetical protein
VNQNISEEIRVEENRENFFDDYIASLPLPVEEKPAVIDPDNPPWGIGVGLLVWFSSVILIFIFQTLFLIPYLIANAKDSTTVTPEMFTTPTAIFIIVLSVLPAHIMTIWLVWFVVTGARQRPFRETLGWDWDNAFGLVLSALLAVALLIIGGVLIYFIGHNETEVDRIIKTAGSARFVLAFIAAFTAPLTEELVYRGILYSAFKKKTGTIFSVIAVTLLFALVHVPQYKESLGVLTVILMLSFVLTMLRAKTGKILPCIIVHFIFNGLQALGIVFSPYFEKLSPEPVKQQAVIILKTFIS